jgi:hypothetical protein
MSGHTCAERRQRAKRLHGIQNVRKTSSIGIKVINYINCIVYSPEEEHLSGNDNNSPNIPPISNEATIIDKQLQMEKGSKRLVSNAIPSSLHKKKTKMDEYDFGIGMKYKFYLLIKIYSIL